TLLGVPAGTPSQRLLAHQTAKMLAGIAHAVDGLALLLDAPRRRPPAPLPVDAPGRPLPGHHRFRLSGPDWAPAFVNAGRAFVAIGAVELFWVVTAWPSGASAIVFVAIFVVLLSPKGDQAYIGALAFTVGVAVGVPAAAIVKFAVLPDLSTFPAFCGALGLCVIPIGFVMAQSRQPAVWAVAT